MLYLFLAGNVAMELNANQNRTIGHVLDIFLDTEPGGQNTLNGLGAGNPLNGLTFDSGFEADHLFELYGDAGPQGASPSWGAWYADLTAGGQSGVVNLGWGTAGGPGTLSGGTNPHGILATIDNHNVAGVTYGCNASSGAGVTTGIEWAIPLAAIGNPAGCMKLTVILRDQGTTQTAVSNQVLAPVPPGTCPLGDAATLSFAAIAGDQFFSYCPTATGVPGPIAARGLKLVLGANPARGTQLRVGFELADERPASLQVIDCQGRLVRQTRVAAGTGSGSADLSQGRRLSPGLYWVRLTQGGASAVQRLCVVR